MCQSVRRTGQHRRLAIDFDAQYSNLRNHGALAKAAQWSRRMRTASIPSAQSRVSAARRPRRVDVQILASGCDEVDSKMPNWTRGHAYDDGPLQTSEG